MIVFRQTRDETKKTYCPISLGAICNELPLFKQHYLWQYVQLLHNRLLYRCTSI